MEALNVIRSTTTLFNFPKETVKEFTVRDLSRGCAKGKPYLTSVTEEEFMGGIIVSIYVEVFENELSMTVTGIKRGGDLRFFGRTLADIVN